MARPVNPEVPRTTPPQPGHRSSMVWVWWILFFLAALFLISWFFGWGWEPAVEAGLLDQLPSERWSEVTPDRLFYG